MWAGALEQGLLIYKNLGSKPPPPGACQLAHVLTSQASLRQDSVLLHQGPMRRLFKKSMWRVECQRPGLRDHTSEYDSEVRDWGLGRSRDFPQAFNLEPNMEMGASDPPPTPGDQEAQRPQLALSMELPWGCSLLLPSSLPGALALTAP